MTQRLARREAPSRTKVAVTLSAATHLRSIASCSLLGTGGHETAAYACAVHITAGAVSVSDTALDWRGSISSVDSAKDLEGETCGLFGAFQDAAELILDFRTEVCLALPFVGDRLALLIGEKIHLGFLDLH